MPFQSQVPSDIFPEGIIPDPVAPHAIEREEGAGQSPEPWQVEPPEQAQTPEPWQVEQPEQAQTPEPLQSPPPEPAPTPEPWQVEQPEQAPQPEPWEPDEHEPAQSPAPIEWPAPQPIESAPPAEYDTGRNTAAPVEPIEWVDRRVDLPPLPPVDVVAPVEAYDRARIRFGDGPVIRDTYWAV